MNANSCSPQQWNVNRAGSIASAVDRERRSRGLRTRTDPKQASRYSVSPPLVCHRVGGARGRTAHCARKRCRATIAIPSAALSIINVVLHSVHTRTCPNIAWR